MSASEEALRSTLWLGAVLVVPGETFLAFCTLGLKILLFSPRA